MAHSRGQNTSLMPRPYFHGALPTTGLVECRTVFPNRRLSAHTAPGPPPIEGCTTWLPKLQVCGHSMEDSNRCKCGGVMPKTLRFPDHSSPTTYISICSGSRMPSHV